MEHQKSIVKVKSVIDYEREEQTEAVEGQWGNEVFN